MKEGEQFHVEKAGSIMNIVGRPEFHDLDADAAPFAWLPLLLAFLLRNWRIVLGCVGGAILLGCAYLLLATPKFTAVTQLLIDTRQGSAFQQQVSTTLDSQADNAIVESQVEVLRSNGTARQVVAQLRLTGDREFLGWGANSPRAWIGRLFSPVDPPDPGAAMSDDAVSQAAERLQSMAGIRRIGLSNVIEVSVRSPSAARSAQLANALTTTYIEDTLRAKYDVTRQAAAWLQDRLKELRDQSVAADRALQEQRARIGIVETDKGGMNEQALGDLTLQLDNARARSTETAARFSRIEAITATGLMASGSVADALANTVILKLRQDYLDDGRRLADWTARFGARHTAVLSLGREMVGLRAAIGDELRRIQETYRSDAAVARGNQAALQLQVDHLVGVSTAANGARAQIRALESLADTYRALYGSFLQRYTQAAQDQSFPISQARIISPATPPLHRSAPSTPMVLLAASVAGLAAGLAAGLVREATDRRFQTAEQVREATGIDCIGLLPMLDRQRARDPVPVQPQVIPSQPSGLRAAVDQPRSPFGEAIRRLRVVDPRGRSRAGVIGVVSAGTGEGRSTLAANLAQALAVSGQRTVLVDGDWRRPQLSRWLAPGSTAGFNEVASGMALAQVAWRDPKTGLTFLPASSYPAHPSLTQAVMESLKAGFDRVVIDLPALPNLADAPVARFVDGFIVAVEWSRTQQQTLIDGLETADLDASRVIGVALTKVDLAASRRFSSAPRYRALPAELDAA